MIIYILLALIILVLSKQYDKRDDVGKNRIWTISCILMLLVIGCRSVGTGGDTIQYIRYFESVQSVGWEGITTVTNKDYGFAYLIKIISYVTKSNLCFLLITAFLSCIGVWDYIKRNSENPVLALYFYITLINFWFLITGMRQSIAMSICLLSLRFIEKKKIFPFVALVMLAATIHKSAFLFLPIYFIARWKISKRTAFWSVLFSVVAAVGNEYFLGLIKDTLGYEYGVENVANGFVVFVIFVGIVVVGLFYRKQWIEAESDIEATNISVIATMLWSIRLFSRTAERPSMYFQSSLPIVLTNSIYRIKNKKTANLILLVFEMVALLLFIKRAIDTPYAFFWN